MKTKYLLLLLAVVLPVVSQAQFTQPLNVSFTSLVTTTFNLVWVVFAIIAVICFVFAGILFLTAQGEAGKITQAKSAVVWGAVGIGVAILGYSIINIIMSLF